jgi:hypothetical protein
MLKMICIEKMLKVRGGTERELEQGVANYDLTSIF